jgi:1,4-dihydroxy-2-naphthoyl-CoA hydrolase
MSRQTPSNPYAMARPEFRDAPGCVAFAMVEQIDKLAWLRALRTRGLPDALGIEVLELEPTRVVATMPVDDRTRQPFGLLHGGASVALAETTASLGAFANIDPTQFAAVGLEINANHIRAKRDGMVRATAEPIHVGRTTQVWTIRIADEDDRTVCVARCTIAIVKSQRPTE